MEISIDIPDKIYAEIKEMCEYNSIGVDDYIFNCTLDNFNIMKYGDLNEKIMKKENVDAEEKPQVSVEKKKVGRPRKKKEEAIQNIVVNAEKPMEVVTNEIKVEEAAKPLKKKRILKTK